MDERAGAHHRRWGFSLSGYVFGDAATRMASITSRFVEKMLGCSKSICPADTLFISIA